MPIRIVVLDIDGVLNDHAKQPNGYCGIDAPCRDQLNRILAETGAFLVISSAWRYLVHGKSMAILGLQNVLLTHGVCCHGKILDVTDKDHDIWDRGDQISSWLRDHPEVERYVVLDNDDLGISRCGHPFVQTDGARGLKAMDADRAIAILKGEPKPEPDMTLNEAASALYDHFGCGVYPHWVQSIGVAAVGQYNDTARICVLLVRKPRHHEGVIPATWHGYPVESKVIGEVRIGASG